MVLDKGRGVREHGAFGLNVHPFINVIEETVRGVLNIVIGVVFIAGGLSGRLALIGTHSGMALAVVGVGLIVLGIVRIVGSRGA